MKCKYLSLLASAVFAVLLLAAPSQAALAQNGPDLTSFAVLGGPAVTLTGSMVNGNVGSLVAYTNTGSTVSGTVYQGVVAQPAYNDFLGAYTNLAAVPCGTTLTGNLAGLVLPPGVYCVAAASTTTGGVLTLAGSSTDTWIFKIGTSGTGALTGTNFTVKMSSGETCSVAPNVYWWTAQAATLTDSVFIGSILAGADITVTGGSFDGQALATGAVTLTNTNISVCRTPTPPPPLYPPIKVTGGGQIPVPNPDSTGQATFGFNAQPDKKGGAKGNFNYVNHMSGLHVNGDVTSIQVIEVNPNGSPKTVLFSGTWEGGSFFVTVQDNGEPGTNDQFGVTVTTAAGALIEVTSQRVISNGNIQFHKP
jgi:hypothetical protein